GLIESCQRCVVRVALGARTDDTRPRVRVFVGPRGTRPGSTSCTGTGTGTCVEGSDHSQGDDVQAGGDVDSCLGCRSLSDCCFGPYWQDDGGEALGVFGAHGGIFDISRARSAEEAPALTAEEEESPKPSA